jgi:hypothetical protein
MPASTPFSGKPEKVNPATPPPTVAVPLGVLRTLLNACWVAQVYAEEDNGAAGAFAEAADRVTALLNQHRPT